MLDAHNGLFAATFPAPTLVQMFLVVHCLWTGVMGVLCTWDPSFSPITENGVFKRDGSKDKILHPNVRGACSVRGGSMFLTTAGALHFGTRETYLVAMAAACWREAYDCIELLRCTKRGHVIVLRVWRSPFGPQPPLVVFLLLNLLAMWAILTAD